MLVQEEEGTMASALMMQPTPRYQRAPDQIRSRCNPKLNKSPLVPFEGSNQHNHHVDVLETCVVVDDAAVVVAVGDDVADVAVAVAYINAVAVMPLPKSIDDDDVAAA